VAELPEREDDVDGPGPSGAPEDHASVQTIQGVKGSLMGPLAGVGDSAFHGTLRPIFSGIGASLGLHGNYIAPLAFLLPVNAVHLVVRWTTQRAGFRLGSRLFERIDHSALKRLMEGASITGLMGVGALVGTWLSITVPLTYTEGKAQVKVQEMLDNIMPKLVPLLITLGVFWAIRRGVNAVIVLLVLAVAGFGFGALGVLGAG
jgi:mannose/fructose/N-acetylgalactosamine-specific phosphotransferase system component IID